MATLTLRIPKGSPLTNAELDDNFTQLDQTKIQLGGDIGGSTSSPTVISLRGRTLSSAVPTTGQAIVWNGSAWLPQTVTLGDGSGSSIVTSVATTTVNTGSTTYPTFSAYPDSSITQTILSNGAQQKVLFQAEEWDNNNNFADSKFTPTVAGYYQINATVRMDGPIGTGESMITIWKNGAEYHRGWNASGTEVGANWFAMQVSALCYANGTGDYFEIYVQQVSGESRNITVAGQAGFGNITWFNGVYVPTQLITSVSASTVVTSTATGIGGGGGGGNANVTILNDISNRLNGRTRNFILKNGASAITESIDYVDNKDFLVFVGGSALTPYLPQEPIHPWIPLPFALDLGKNTYRVSGPTLKLTTPPRGRQTAQIRINNISASRQQRYRYPFTASTIVFGD